MNQFGYGERYNTMITVKKKGKSPHSYRSMEQRKNRPRGSRPIEILEGIYDKGPIFICPITGEDPGKYARKYKKIWTLQRIHYPISYAELKIMGVKDPNAIQYVMFASPNGHNMLDNYRKGIVTMEQHEAQVCHNCKINSWDMFLTHQKVLRMENHHVHVFGTVPLCPTCHAATDDHSVNDDKVPFPAEKFMDLLSENVVSIDRLYFELKKHSPKLTPDAIKIKFYALGLHRFYDRRNIPVPSCIQKHFQNPNAKNYFDFD